MQFHEGDRTTVTLTRGASVPLLKLLTAVIGGAHPVRPGRPDVPNCVVAEAKWHCQAGSQVGPLSGIWEDSYYGILHTFTCQGIFWGGGPISENVHVSPTAPAYCIGVHLYCHAVILSMAVVTCLRQPDIPPLL